MILLKQHGPHPWLLTAGGLQCRVAASRQACGSQGGDEDGALPGAMSPVGDGDDTGHDPVLKVEGGPRAELPTDANTQATWC